MQGRSVSVALVALALPFLLAACEEEAPEAEAPVRPVRAIKVADASGYYDRWFPGRAKATQELDLSFRVPGRMVERPVDVGTVVEQGDRIARLDPDTFETAVGTALGNLERARAEDLNAVQDLERDTVPYQQGHISKARLDQTTARSQIAKANVSTRESQLRQARLELGYADLVAPFDGRIVATYSENFEDVRAKQPIVRLLDTSKIEMVVDIPESLIGAAPLVRNVIVIYDAFPDRIIPAEIKEIGTEASLTTRTFPVTLIMDQPDDIDLLPGMAGRSSAENIASATGYAIEVPVAAVVTLPDTGDSYVWVIDEAAGSVSKRGVQVGQVSSRGVTILDGLNAGEWVAVAGANYLREGQAVAILAE